MCECIEDYFYSRKRQICIYAFCDDGWKFHLKEERCVKRGGGGGRPRPRPTPGPKPVAKKCKSKKQAWNSSKGKCTCKTRYVKAVPSGYKGIYFSKTACKLIRHKWCPYKKTCSSRWTQRWNNKKCKCESRFGF